jgi:DnaJ-class molecular chaperone
MEHWGKQKGILTRACSKCGGDLGDRYGKQRYCKSCHAANMRATRPKHRDLPMHAKIKANCRAMTGHYVKRGLIVKTPCKECGSLNVEAHHNDYTKPMEVLWFCRKHHLEFHAQSKDQ